MNIMTKVLIAAITLCLAPFAMACDYPNAPQEMPDGSTATKEEMLAGVGKIKAFQQAMTDYRSCLEANEVLAVQALSADDTDGRDRQKEIATQRYDASVEDENRIVEEFNAQIRAYKARSD